jgi:hypothetical protein
MRHAIPLALLLAASAPMARPQTDGKAVFDRE